MYHKSVFGGSLFSPMHGSLVTSELLAESGGDVSLHIGYNFGQDWSRRWNV